MSRCGAAALGCAAGLLGPLLSPASTSACSRVTPETFSVDPRSAANDNAPPEPFRNVSALTHRIDAEHCVNGVCTSNSCGDAGVLVLRFDPPSEAGTEELGYRIDWIDGDLPQSLRDQLGFVLPLQAAEHLEIELGWRGITELNGQLALIAVDRAGNESERSDPVRVSWSGCTDYYDDLFCLSSAPVSRSSQSCSVLPGASGAGALPLSAVSLAALGWTLRRRRLSLSLSLSLKARSSSR